MEELYGADKGLPKLKISKITNEFDQPFLPTTNHRKNSLPIIGDIYELTPAVSPASMPYHRIKTENLAKYSQKEFKNSKLTKIATIQIKETNHNPCNVDQNLTPPYFIWCPAKVKEPAVKLLTHTAIFCLHSQNDRIIPKDVTEEILPLNIQSRIETFLPIIGPKCKHKFGQFHKDRQKFTIKSNSSELGLNRKDLVLKGQSGISLSTLQSCLVPLESSLRWNRLQLHHHNGKELLNSVNNKIKNCNDALNDQVKVKVKSKESVSEKAKPLNDLKRPTTMIVSFDKGVSFGNRLKSSETSLFKDLAVPPSSVQSSSIDITIDERSLTDFVPI